MEKPLPIYVPRDEQFEESKAGTFSFCRLKAVLHNLLPSLTTNISSKHDFTGFKHLDSLFSEGLLLNLGLHDELLKKLPQVVSKIQTTSQGLLKFDTPVIISSKSYQTIAFINTYTINCTLKDVCHGDFYIDNVFHPTTQNLNYSEYLFAN